MLIIYKYVNKLLTVYFYMLVLKLITCSLRQNCSKYFLFTLR